VGQGERDVSARVRQGWGSALRAGKPGASDRDRLAASRTAFLTRGRASCSGKECWA